MQLARVQYALCDWRGFTHENKVDHMSHYVGSFRQFELQNGWYPIYVITKSIQFYT